MRRESFRRLVQEALAELPTEFCRYLNGLEVRIEDYPDDDLMAEWGLVPPDYPFGMYEGPALPDVDTPSDCPGTMGLYKQRGNGGVNCTDLTSAPKMRTVALIMGAHDD